jgi:hypothetical protein
VSVVPNAGGAYVDPRKLTYIFNSGKGRFFILHGFAPSRSQELAAALRQHVVVTPYEDVFPSVHGTKYTVRGPLTSPDGRNPNALSVWMVDAGGAVPRLVTAYASP